MFGRLVDMATRTLIIDLSKGTGGEPMYGIVTVQRARATSEGTFEVLPWETKLKLHNGVATITEAVTDGSGPLYRSAYIIRVQNGYCAPRWGFMAALPDGTTPISTGEMPKVNPITGEGIYMDAQEWNALYGTLPDRVTSVEQKNAEQDTRLDGAEVVTESAPFYRRGTLPGDVDIFSLRYASDTGFYTIGSANTNPNLPNQPGVAGELWVVSTGNATKHILTWRSKGGTYEIDATGGTFSLPWRRTDRIDDALFVRVNEMEPKLDDLAGSNPVRVRGTLDPAQDLRGMTSQTWNGIWTVGSANANPGLPSTPGVPGRLIVENTANDRYMRLDWRDAAGSYEIRGQGTAWYDWDRIDRPFSYKGNLPDGTDLNDMTSTKWNGLWQLGTTQNYPNRPEGEGARVAGLLEHYSSGNGSLKQSVTYRNDRGDFVRKLISGTSYTPWKDPYAGAGNDTTKIEQRLALIEEMYPQPETPFENTNTFTTYDAGEAYMDWVARTYSDKVSILDLGYSRRGLPIRAFQLGDPTKPTYYLMASQHGSEPMGREAALIWIRELCEDETPETATFLQNYCVVVTPCVNVDMINVQRLSSSNTDLNRNWITKTTAEIQAASSVFSTHNVVLTLDAHEGGKWASMQAGIVSAPEAAQSLKDVSQGLYDAVDADFVAASENFETYPGDDVLEIARNAVAVQYKSASIVFEGASGLDSNMYAPDVVWRRSVYLLAYRSVFDHLKTNMNDFVVAKTTAG